MHQASKVENLSILCGQLDRCSITQKEGVNAIRIFRRTVIQIGLGYAGYRLTQLAQKVLDGLDFGSTGQVGSAWTDESVLVSGA